MNSKKTIWLTAIVALIVYNVVMFIMPVAKDLNFWFAYVFSTISILFAAGTFISNITRKSVDKKIKNTPLAYIAWEYLIIQMILGFYEILHPIYYRTSLILNVILLGINIIILSIVSTEKKEIDRVDKKVKEKVFFIKNIQEELESTKAITENEKITNGLNELVDTVRYSDPMSSSKLFDIENDIEIKVAKLKDNIKENKESESIEGISEIKTLLAERNRKAKLYKGMPEPDETNDKPANNRAIIVAVVTLTVLLVSGIVSYYSIILPNSQYAKAEQLLLDKKYFEAKEAFELMSGYKDSDNKAKEAMYQYASDLVKSEDYEEAVEVFEELGDYSDSKTRIKQIYYDYATGLLEQGNYADAISIYEEIKDYKDSEDKAKEFTYVYATELLNAKEYSKAAEQFLRVLDYKDSKSRVMEIYNSFGDSDVVYFGQYNETPIEWQILDTQDDKVLLITKDIIEEKAYNAEFKSIDWENSTLRKWLIEDFYNTFDSNEKERILQYDDESDYVFLLTRAQVNKYSKLKNTSQSWWIRTADEGTTAMYMNENGTLNKDGELVTKLNGVRPCIWLNIK